MAALEALAPDIDAGKVGVVLIHDGARPFINHDLVDRVIAAARSHQGAIPGLIPQRTVFRRSDDGQRAERLATATLRRVQTPQAFSAPLLLKAYRESRTIGFEGVDTAEVVAQFGGLDAVVVEGDPVNIKVTTTADLEQARRIAATHPRTLRR